MYKLGDICQVGSLSIGISFLFEEDAQSNAFSQPCPWVILEKKPPTNGVALVVVAPGDTSGEAPPHTSHREIDYIRRVRPLL